MRRIILYVLAVIIGAYIGITALPSLWSLFTKADSWWNQVWANGIIGAIIFIVIITFLMNFIIRGLDKFDNSIAGLNLTKGIFRVSGIIIGLLIGVLLSIPITMLHIPILSNILATLVIIFIGYVGYSIFSRRGEDVVRTLFRQGKRINESTKTTSVAKAKLLDTSVIIDGRVFDIIKTGFLGENIVIPNFVLLELQALSDSSDSLKRAKGRRGLDFVNELRQGNDAVIKISDKDYKDLKEVDTKLLRFATETRAELVTNDYNLNKLAEIQGVKVLNINNLANAVKQQVMVAEELIVLIVKEGSERHQGIGYLPDGTMVVVEDSDKLIGKAVNATVTKVLQTSAGRMIFADIKK
ncbi:PIN/TRAM domain-containing protein [Lactovum miscens]|uniref:Uncharacterized protein YacL n=1 Tax=Lactovum miscens TaxID=190387 RepID=A0A841C6V4_9LACT|nr:PIN domain-containing protein [Lactovum miscens]MBB5887281.1 uncharacterized protein YacL [Lactovum miscens]